MWFQYYMNCCTCKPNLVETLYTQLQSPWFPSNIAMNFKAERGLHSPIKEFFTHLMLPFVFWFWFLCNQWNPAFKQQLIHMILKIKHVYFYSFLHQLHFYKHVCKVNNHLFPVFCIYFLLLQIELHVMLVSHNDWELIIVCIFL